jgi:hypothetical protein
MCLQYWRSVMCVWWLMTGKALFSKKYVCIWLTFRVLVTGASLRHWYLWSILLGPSPNSSWTSITSSSSANPEHIMESGAIVLLSVTFITVNILCSDIHSKSWTSSTFSLEQNCASMKIYAEECGLAQKKDMLHWNNMYQIDSLISHPLPSQHFKFIILSRIFNYPDLNFSCKSHYFLIIGVL